MSPTVYRPVCLLSTKKPFVEESELFPGFKQTQIEAKLLNPGYTERRLRAHRRRNGSRGAIKIQKSA